MLTVAKPSFLPEDNTPPPEEPPSPPTSKNYFSWSSIKQTQWPVHSAKTHSLGIRPVWSEPSLCALWVAEDPNLLHADSDDCSIRLGRCKTNQMTCVPIEDSSQPGHLSSLIRAFAVHFIGSWGPKLVSCGQRRLWSDLEDAKPTKWPMRPA